MWNREVIPVVSNASAGPEDVCWGLWDTTVAAAEALVLKLGCAELSAAACSACWACWARCLFAFCLSFLACLAAALAAACSSSAIS